MRGWRYLRRRSGKAIFLEGNGIFNNEHLSWKTGIGASRITGTMTGES
jgi:hypothetical protein